MAVARALPQRARRLVGAWCFADHFGPVAVDGAAGMRVGPHPHIGLQTVSWLVAGEVLHRDSLGSEQLIRPGELNLMTAGRGIVHSEETPGGSTWPLHGVQLWVALPEAERHREPAFHHHSDLPVLDADGVRVTVLMGSLFGATSPAVAYTPLVGLELAVDRAERTLALPLDPTYEYVVLVLDGGFEVDGLVVPPDVMAVVEPGSLGVDLRSTAAGHALVLGGAPLGEEVAMWWNFVARTRPELEAAAAVWSDGGFGTVHGFRGPRIPAPVPWWLPTAD